MKKSLTVYIFVAVIILLHLIVFVKLRRSASPEAPAPEASVTETPGVTEADVPQLDAKARAAVEAAKPRAVPSAPAVPQPPAVAKPSAPAGMPGPYYNGFFRVAEKAMPDSLKKTVSQVRSGVVIDLDTNTILWQKNASAVHPIASLTKLLTSIMLMEYLETHPAESLQTKITITANDRKYFKNHKINGVYLDTNEQYTLDEMLMCMLVASANDCAYIVGEHIAGGNAEQFVSMMNARARELGLTDMKFHNANGLPVNAASGRQENTGTALDVAYLGLRASKYADIMKWGGTLSSKIRADKKNPFDINSTNHLLRDKVPGVTGLKTGYTDGAGYCIVVPCDRGGKKRMVVAMGVNANGTDRGKLRDKIVKQLLDWSYGL